MPDADLVSEVIEVATRLISESRSGEIQGEDVSREIERADVDLYWAFQEVKRQRVLDMYFPGGMTLPSIVRLP
jgi:hypothetical protein